MRWLAPVLILMSASIVMAGPVTAQPVVTSARADAVSVTLYRDPDRRIGTAERRWPGGYALITETRSLRIPAGRSVIRFEGVSEGMLPESAIVTGLPEGVAEKNRDALLLSPAGLVDAYLTRRVHLRRTNRATGSVREQDAIIRSGPNGGVVLETDEGFEALSCSGLPERLTYDGVPEGLSAKPTLSVVTDSVSAVTVTVTLSYLAQGFDWSAAYVASVAEDGETMDLFAWLTMANGGAQSFPDASTQAVAGQPNKGRDGRRADAPATQLRLECWPMDITSTHPRYDNERFEPPMPPMMMAPVPESSEIIVTAQRRDRAMASPVAIMAVQEDLGDLKLYRIPIPVTVSALGQKQVAMIDKRRVPFDRIYTASVDDGSESPAAMAIELRTRNVATKQLGLPLPAGRVSVFQSTAGRPLLVGKADLADRAIGEEVELKIGMSPDVRIATVSGARPSAPNRVRITNARAVPVAVEVLIPYELQSPPRDVVRKDGGWVWRTTVPANGDAAFSYTFKVERN